jgi:serine/threonine-protein kinase
MGAVLLSSDPELGRDLALKVMLGDCAARPDVVQRFREEAQVGGQLQHPGVVPVYELGKADDGRPYFTMKLVKGQTLAKLLKERPDPSHERVRLLKVFEQVCQAVGYAHSKGVIHRDLKPSNVMVGAFGEVQVMDWGLAKVLNPAPAPEPATLHTAATVASLVRVSRAERDSAETQEGDVLGTPAYMPPEQALGEVGRLDRRCDVFSLGAILCEVLTGRPPYTATDRVSLLRQARRAELGDALARLEACGADEELVGLARRCLAAEPDDRPRDAGEVAQAVEAYLAGVEERARRAELERAAALARAEEAKQTARAEQARAREAEAREAAERRQAEEAWARAGEAEARARAERRARRLTVGLAASVLLLAAGGGVGAWLVQQHRAEVAQRRREADRLTRQAAERGRELLRKGWEGNDRRLLDDARAEAEKAVELARSSDANPEARQEAEELQQQVQAKLEQWKKNDELMKALLDVTAPYETRRFAQGEGGVMVALAEPTVEEQFARAFRTWGLDIDPDPLEAVAARLGGQPRPVVEQVVAGLEAWLLDRRRRKDTAGWQRLLALADRLDSDAGRRAVRALLDGDRLALAHNGLGAALAEQKRPREAEAAYRRATVLKPDFAEAYNNLGKALADQKRTRESEAAYRKAIALRPDDAKAYNNLGAALGDQKKYAEAEGAFRKAIALRPDYALAYNGLGNALRAQRKLAEAVAAFRKADQLLPNHPVIRSNLRRTQRWLELDGRLPALLAGKENPGSPQEQVQLAAFCLTYKEHHRAAAGFYADAFAAEPGLAGDLRAQHRYNAACAAALAVAGKGEDASRLPDRVVLTLRRQALRWLRADLAAYAQFAGRDDPKLRQTIRQRLGHWQQDADLAPVRDVEALNKLPDHERDAWRRLWADVDDLRRKAGGGR